LRLSIKMVGDWTKRLDALHAGTDVKVMGPYGQFAERAFVTKKPGVWIAGGIGVTPFLSMLKDRSVHAPESDIAMFYCTKNEADAPYDAEIAGIVPRMPNVEYVRHRSDAEGFVTAQTIAGRVTDLADRLILLCGPLPMMRKLEAAFVAMGVPRRNIQYEDFSLR
jgi:predicted ferric reductase